MKIIHQNEIRFAEVKFFFLKSFGDASEALAVVSLYSPPDKYLLQSSYDTLCVCRYEGEDSLVVISAKSIISVVAMVPFPFTVGGHNNQYFMIEQIGLDVVEADVSVN